VELSAIHARLERKMAEQVRKPVHAIATNITSALGLDTRSHWQAIMSGNRGVREYSDEAFSKHPFWASKLDVAQWQYIQERTKGSESLTPFEQLAVFSAKQALEQLDETLQPSETIVILSTTKGNVELLDRIDDERVLLSYSAEVISNALGFNSVKPQVISHACVSGVLASVYAMRLLQSGRYKNAIVIGCDRFTRFVLSGFQSFHAIDKQACRPFDAARSGINLGEAAATVILSTEDLHMPLAKIIAGSSSNDANHISGPSRTGEELGLAIKAALNEAKLDAGKINMISAHGTATKYNDEMEARAFDLCGFATTPVHSTKGYTGHTLGAAGVLESVLVIESIQHRELIPTIGYEEHGVPVSLNITTSATPAEINYVLKTASGFGGSNATAIWARV